MNKETDEHEDRSIIWPGGYRRLGREPYGSVGRLCGAVILAEQRADGHSD
jgi:hypothetical protein